LYATPSHSSGQGDSEDQEDYFNIESHHPGSGNVSPRKDSWQVRLPSQDKTSAMELFKRSQKVGFARLATFERVSQASNFSQKDPRLPCFLPKPHIKNPDFFGRRDVLRKTENALLPPSPMHTNLAQAGKAGLRTFGLCGLGGVGKTEIAVEFMFAHREDFDAVFWVQSNEPAKIADGFCQIAMELGLEEAGRNRIKP
jgi:hypothetical protein